MEPLDLKNTLLKIASEARTEKYEAILTGKDSIRYEGLLMIYNAMRALVDNSVVGADDSKLRRKDYEL